MKIILSRKGFDSGAGHGECASPIFPTGAMASFPIPYADAQHTMAELVCDEHNLGDVARDLTPRRRVSKQINSDSTIHLDPYLNRPKANRPAGWRPAFGQDGAAQTELRNQGVGPGDIFLFFGWFRKVEEFGIADPIRWRFVPNAPDIHAIFGWLQVGKVLKVGQAPTPGLYPSWLADHPHIQDANQFPQDNTIYIASTQLHVAGKPTGIRGGGVFDKFSPLRQLTQPGQPKRSTWQLPNWFHPFVVPPRPPLTHHPKNWPMRNDATAMLTLQSAAIGQEFILDDGAYPEAQSWLMQLFERRDPL